MSQMMSTDSSSKGVLIVSMPACFTSGTSVRKIVHGKAGFGEPLHVFVVCPALEIGMDEGVELAELELQRAAHAARLVGRAHLADDVGRVLKIALVVVGEVVDEEFSKENGFCMGILHTIASGTYPRFQSMRTRRPSSLERKCGGNHHHGVEAALERNGRVLDVPSHDAFQMIDFGDESSGRVFSIMVSTGFSPCSP